ncbi:MAG: VWA domain-containing protein [Paludibacteraceae bacterium]|nr:VWA domain-containing protein [Paludibacteraceae bacterium]
MFRFAHPEMLYLLLVLLLMVVIYIFKCFGQQRRLRRFGNPDLLLGLMPDYSAIRPHVKFGITVLAMALLVIALAQPQFGTKKQTEHRQGIESIFVLDVSNSMRATDVEPSRLDNAKMMLSKLLDEMVDDKIGLIIFAGDAYVQMPISSDNVSAKMFLSTINPGSVPVPGTAIGTAIEMAVKSFGDIEDQNIGRTIILITDGENHEDDAVEAARIARESGITVNVVGVGSVAGSPIPVPRSSDFWRDQNGEVVVSALDEQMCKQVAAAGGGIFVRATNSNSALRALTSEVGKMQKGELDVSAYSAYDDKFYIFAWMALVLLIVEFLTLGRQNRWLNKFKWFER